MTKIETQIGQDLELCGLIDALGSASAKRKARKHRKACYDAIREMNKADGLDNMSADELLAELLS